MLLFDLPQHTIAHKTIVSVRCVLIYAIACLDVCSSDSETSSPHERFEIAQIP